jgi:hypothetical protein
MVGPVTAKYERRETPRQPPMTEVEVQGLRDWLLSDSLDWDAVERARGEAWVCAELLDPTCPGSWQHPPSSP